MDIEASLERVRHWLPMQGPIKDFVHHNTLHAFQHLKFNDAIRAAGRLYDAKRAMAPAFFLDRYRAGEISESALDRVLTMRISDLGARDRTKAKMLAGDFEISRAGSFKSTGVRAQWSKVLGEADLNRLVQPVLFNLIGGYLDQGLSNWRMPGADRLDFFEAVIELNRNSWISLLPRRSAHVKKLMQLTAVDCIQESLRLLVGYEPLYEAYILELLLSQPGWAGLVSECERHPENLIAPRKIRLLDYVAVALLIEVGALERKLGASFRPLGACVSEQSRLPDLVPAADETDLLLQIWQDAFEWSYYEALLGGIKSSPSQPAQHVATSAWAFFCIDERECSLRRHLEEVTSAIETFATAGFFGLEFMYLGAEDRLAGKHGPVPLQPKHLILEEIPAASPKSQIFCWRKTFPLEPQANTFFRGWILSQALGLGAAVRLAASVFRPSLNRVAVAPLSTVTPHARLKLTRENDSQIRDGLWIGYSIMELVDRVEKLLTSTGVPHDWPRLIVFFGHGSSSVNNPYFAAYNCGACSGRPGAPNARAIAQAANLPEVRRILQTRGIEIPDHTWFVGGMHDTSKDEVTYYDTNEMPRAFDEDFRLFKSSVEKALERNSLERCRRFETIPVGISAAQARAEVRTRAISLFEPRPEYNHATNAACIVGRRSLTESLFLDRRAFLSSYDPERDDGAAILAQILQAIVPVCVGINLEYFFSRVDPDVYGAGTKLSHNVSGLIGVTNGIESDLLTGLPTQMTEIHDPVRLLLVVEQTPDLALTAAKSSTPIFELVENEWLRYACTHPISREIWMYSDGRMQRVEGLKSLSVSWSDSISAARSGRKNLPPGRIRKAERSTS